jgi:hypothetical protein
VAAGTFSAAAIAGGSVLVLTLPTLGLTLAVLLAATLRKSPFDIASSHQLVLVLIVLAVGRLPVVALILVGVTYGAVVIADNSLPRATWRMALAVAWGVGGSAAIIALVTAGALGGGILR